MERASPVTETLAEDWSCAADFLDDIEVDAKGMCRWTDVANAQTHIRAALRSVQPRGVAQSSRDAVIEECAALCDGLRRRDYSGENEDWIAGTSDCATAIRALLDTSTDRSSK